MSPIDPSRLKIHVHLCVERRLALAAALLKPPVESEVDHLITVLYEGGISSLPEQAVLERMVAIDVFDTLYHIFGYQNLLDGAAPPVSDGAVMTALSDTAFLLSLLQDESVPKGLRDRLNAYFTEYLGPHEPDLLTAHSRILDILLATMKA